jgi:ribonuclease P protein subunit RPR2
MAKGKNPGGAEQRGPPPLPNRDVFHRINFAYQSAAFFQHLAPAGPSITIPLAASQRLGAGEENTGKKRKRKAGTKADLPIPSASPDEGSEWSKLARKGTREMKKMAVHTQIKL